MHHMIINVLVLTLNIMLYGLIILKIIEHARIGAGDYRVVAPTS